MLHLLTFCNMPNIKAVVHGQVFTNPLLYATVAISDYGADLKAKSIEKHYAPDESSHLHRVTARDLIAL